MNHKHANTLQYKAAQLVQIFDSHATIINCFQLPINLENVLLNLQVDLCLWTHPGGLC